MSITPYNNHTSTDEDVFPYPIEYSCLFDGSSDYLSFTPSTSGDRKSFGLSFSAKAIKAVADNRTIISAQQDDLNYEVLYFEAPFNKIRYDFYVAGVPTAIITFDPALTDSTGHHQFFIEKDAVSSTLRAWHNGVEMPQTVTTALPNVDGFIGHNVEHQIGLLRTSFFYGNYYLSELRLLNNLTGAYADFGEFSDLVTGLWIPKDPGSLTYGTNGCYLDFSNASALGTDSSGNNNDWTVNGSPVQTLDTPTNNHCTLNASDNLTTGTLSNGNLTTTGNATVTHKPSSGEWYYEKDGVGVSYNADSSGRFDPTLTAGTYNFGATAWDDTGPTGNEKAINAENMPTDDYDTSGSYTGNGSDNYVYTGCALSQLVISGGGTYDNDGTDSAIVEFYANGFKMVSTTDNVNTTSYTWSGTLKYPYKYSNAQEN